MLEEVPPSLVTKKSVSLQSSTLEMHVLEFVNKNLSSWFQKNVQIFSGSMTINTKCPHGPDSLWVQSKWEFTDPQLRLTCTWSKTNPGHLQLPPASSNGNISIWQLYSPADRLTAVVIKTSFLEQCSSFCVSNNFCVFILTPKIRDSYSSCCLTKKLANTLPSG